MPALKSNSDYDWSKVYDYSEVSLRHQYKSEYKKHLNKSHYLLVRSRLKQILNKGKTFGEIGFGSGITLRLMAKHFTQLYGLDISPLNVETTKKELIAEGFSNITLRITDILKFDETLINKFDVLSYIHGLEHFSFEDYQVFFENIRRYLKPGGYFTGALPCEGALTYRMCPKCGHKFEVDGHLTTHSVSSLKKLFDLHGFKPVYVDNFNVKYHLIKKLPGNIPGFLWIFVKYVIMGRRNKIDQIEFIAQPL
jgi:ubiquinone/menaquinone biosynthesis C-methylase UbiE